MRHLKTIIPSTCIFTVDMNRCILYPVWEDREKVSLVKVFYELTHLFIYLFFPLPDQSLNTSTLTSSLTLYNDSLKPARKPQEWNFLNSRKAWLANLVNKLRIWLGHGNICAFQDPAPEMPIHSLCICCQAELFPRDRIRMGDGKFHSQLNMSARNRGLLS